MSESILICGIRLEVWAFIISVISLLISLLKDVILPLIFRPKLVFKYEEEISFRREDVVINGNQYHRGTFLRFSVQNIGSRPASNCRCSVLEVFKDGSSYGDYAGFPLRWTSRPESIINQASGERLNIALGETEFIDLVCVTNQSPTIVLQKYHSVPIGIRETIEPGEYEIFLIFSGDNFKSRKLHFRIKKPNSQNIKDVALRLIGYK